MRFRTPTLVRNDGFTGPASRPGRPRGLKGYLRALLPGHAAAVQAPVAGGSREHFFHFLLGYLLPLVHQQEVRGLRHFSVLDCGPLMSPLLEQVLESLDLPFLPLRPSQVVRPIFVEPWDHGWDSLSDVRRTAERIAGAIGGVPCVKTDCPRSRNILIRRSSPHPYYMGEQAEIQGYGTSRRRLVNLSDISEHLASAGIAHAVYEPGEHTLSCQIRAFAHAEKVVGVRGAEWANLVWSNPGVSVRILVPNPPAVHLEGLVRRLGIRHELIAAQAAHTPDDPAEVARFFTAHTG